MHRYATHTNAILVYVIPPMLVGIIVHTLARSYLWSSKVENDKSVFDKIIQMQTPSAIVECCVFDAHILWNVLVIAVLQYYSIASAFFWLILAVSGLARAPLLRLVSCGMSGTLEMLCTVCCVTPPNDQQIRVHCGVCCAHCSSCCPRRQ